MVKGVFGLQAPDAEIKGRVIKKARRRNPMGGEEGQEKKSAFASFGGFTSTAAPPAAAAADAFSFLAKSPSTTSSETKKPETGASKLCSNMLNVCSSSGITQHSLYRVQYRCAPSFKPFSNGSKKKNLS